MANLGKVGFLVLVLFLISKAITSGMLTFVLTDHQEFTIEEIYDHQESDDQFKLKFLDDYSTMNHHLFVHFFNEQSSRGYQAFNAAIFHGFIKLAFKPPSVA
jgi:hypothetical protein